MNSKTAYSALADHFRDVVALGQVSGLLGWDQETIMPKGAAAQRSEWMSALEKLSHSQRTDPRIADWLDAVDGADLNEVEAANVRLIRRQFERQSKVPAALASQIARVTSQAQGVWAKAREAGDFSAFQDVLTEVLALRREEAAALAEGGNLYDALLEDYEPGMKEPELAQLLGGLRDGLVDLRGRVAESHEAIPNLQGSFSHAQQTMIAHELATAFGYDWTRGRLDFSVHPFSSGSFNDVRITTRVSESDPFNCFYSTIHEVGHATYEQGISQDYGLSMLGRGVSMGVHESQSRILENQLGRSRAFTGFLYNRMLEVFGDFGIENAESFYRVVNKLHRGFIRTEADEVQYNLHVLLRFDLERKMIAGELEVADLEAAWNERFEKDFGYPVDQPANGVLQDVHWSVGLFGYFPTYSLGNIYAGELFEAMSGDLPELQADLGKGDTKAALAWLGDKIHRFGALYEPRETITRAVGHAPTAEPLLAYLNTKFGDIYKL
ncbi:carboxypeptidase M32 [Neptunicoccus sediminis]|uniref:carboxypeptidase M32 n=1 Tax=Neptunicoccus sediminis TaxID=1892596 RepID=UPI000845C750|nr:carboxypeptidase M32 [Neptunicoccus sediminis]